MVSPAIKWSTFVGLYQETLIEVTMNMMPTTIILSQLINIGILVLLQI